MGNDDPCPDSDANNDCGYYWTDDAGDDDRRSQAGNMGGKLGRHSFLSPMDHGLLGLSVYTETSFVVATEDVQVEENRRPHSALKRGGTVQILCAAESGLGA